MKGEKTTLTNIAHGIAGRLFERELKKVLENIADPETSAEAARSIVLEIRFKPGADRSAFATSVAAHCKLPAAAGVAGLVYASRSEDGELGASNIDPTQLSLADQLAAATAR